MKKKTPPKTQRGSLRPLPQLTPSAAPLPAAAPQPGTAADRPSARPAPVEAVSPEGTGVPHPRDLPFGGGSRPAGSGSPSPERPCPLSPPPAVAAPAGWLRGPGTGRHSISCLAGLRSGRGGRCSEPGGRAP